MDIEHMDRDQILNLAINHAGANIPKPRAKAPFVIKGVGKRRGEAALIYKIPAHTRDKPYEKGITFTEFEKAYIQLKSTGVLDRKWFDENLSTCAKEGGCNFTSLGGVFELLGLVRYEGVGRYIRNT